ncbi:MAG TPA: serine/threonine-protein kinase [Labilithrix sp.]|nr:serine/threonine-protein kinase [Labilithrix sp.]
MESTVASPQSKSAELAPGDVIAERYRVVARLGEGGMGVVYSVEHTHMRKLFALKVLHRELLRMPEVVARFEREAVLAGSINHANVAAATDFGKLPDGSFFLILELVVGKGLRELLAEGSVGIARALPIMRGMTAGVAAAHAKGIVHRDLKPENVMLVERDGTSDFVKVLDFGIAKGDAVNEAIDAGSAKGAQPLTQIGAVMGTPDYMSPEQALGQKVDHRSDLYALGVIFYELCTGAPPFRGDAMQVLQKHLMVEAPAVPPELVAGVTVPIAAIVARLLAKEPEARFQTATDLLAAIDGVSPRAPAVSVKALPEPSSARAPDPAAAAGLPTEPELLPVRARVVVGLGSLGLLVLVVVVMAILFTRRDPATTAEADASASSTATAAESGSVTAASAEPPTVIVSASADLPDEDDAGAPAAAASSTPAGGRANRGRRSPPGRPQRRTGPGGIYIPPPSTWFQ